MKHVIAVVCLAVAAPASTGAQTPTNQAALERYELPAEITFPEGIAYDGSSGTVYTGSADTGALVRMSLKTRAAAVITPGGVLVPAESTTFPAVLGMKLDSRNRLWIAGGRTGRVFVVDVKTGKMVGQPQVPDPSKSLINDVALVGDAAYVTDTRTPTLWRVQTGGSAPGPLEAWLDFTGTPLQYGEGANLNGIVATPDGRSLIVVHMGKGLLFRIGVADRTIVPIDTGGAELAGADGLVLDGRTLYVVRQTAVEIATLELSEDLTKATVVNRFKDPALAWPATAVKAGDRLLVVNTQFNTRNDKKEQRPFTIVGVPLARLAGSR